MGCLRQLRSRWIKGRLSVHETMGHGDDTLGTEVGRLSWVQWDAGMAIAARAMRSFAQSAVAVLIAIYLGLHGFSLVQVGAFLTVGAVGAALAAVVAGVLVDAVGRRRTL